MSDRVHIVSIVKPKPEAFDQAVENLQKYADYVEANEPGAFQFQFFRRKRDDGPDDIVFVEQFKDLATFKEHGSSPASQALKKGAAEEDSLLAPPDISIIEPLGGFPQRA